MDLNTATPLKRNRRTCLIVKLAYFFYIGGRSLFVSFVVVFLAKIGLSSTEIGSIRGIQPLIFFLVSPFLGILSDKFSIHRQTLLLGITGSGLCCFSLTFLSASSHTIKHEVELNCTQSKLTLTPGYSERASFNSKPKSQNMFAINENCSDLLNVLPTASDVTAPAVWTMSSYDSVDAVSASVPHVQLFLVSLVLMALGEVCHAGVLPVLDSNSQTLARLSKRSSYGRLRVWGSLGSITILTVTGYILDSLNANITLYHEYFPAFLVYLFCNLLALLPAWNIPLFQQGSRDSALLGNLQNVLSDSSFAMFLVVAFVVGVTSSQDSFKYLLLGELGASHLNRSLCITFNCLGEVPFIFFSKNIIDIIRKEYIFCLTMAAWAVRLATYSVIENPWFILPVELLNGICCGLWLPALTVYCRDAAANHSLSVSVLAVAHAIHTGIGMAAGGFFGGLAYNAVGPRSLFRVVAAINIVMLLIYVLFLKCQKKTDERAVRCKVHDPGAEHEAQLNDNSDNNIIAKFHRIAPFKETVV